MTENTRILSEEEQQIADLQKQVEELKNAAAAQSESAAFSLSESDVSKLNSIRNSSQKLAALIDCLTAKPE